jgi:hydrogenase/urease accessory protein HupE
MDNFLLFLQIGFRHILEGYDHLLFLAGLIIVTCDIKSIFKVATAFTVTHSTTLILSALGILSFNPGLTETLIAASIAYVGIENLFIKNQDYRWLIAGTFGLVHGAGFSGHLTELLKSMLGMGNIWGPLVGFNVGIELGQLTVILLIYPVCLYIRKINKSTVFVPAVSIIIAAAGLFLMVYRIFY